MEQNLTIIVPYRDREKHLLAFVPHMERFLNDVNFQILVVEQAGMAPFNRGALLNTGYQLSSTTSQWIAFHDVDMLALDGRCDYRCPDAVCHLAGCVEQFNYKMPYRNYIGGVLIACKDAFEAVNGYSNEYWGWGAEDDDLYLRFWLNNILVQHRSGLYRSLDHERAKASPANPLRLSKFLNCAAQSKNGNTRVDPKIFRRIDSSLFIRRPEALRIAWEDGLSTLSFRVLSRRPLKELAIFESEIHFRHEVVTVALSDPRGD